MKIQTTLVIAGLVFGALCSVAAEKTELEPRRLVHRALTHHITGNGDVAPKFTDYQTAQVQLDGEGALEFIVLLHSPDYTGRGGSTAFVLRQVADKSFRVLGRHTLMRKDAIWVSKNTSNGWKNIIVRTTGGGADGKQHVLKFNGNSYPLNPSVQEEYKGAESELTPLTFK